MKGENLLFRDPSVTHLAHSGMAPRQPLRARPQQNSGTQHALCPPITSSCMLLFTIQRGHSLSGDPPFYLSTTSHPSYLQPSNSQQIKNQCLAPRCGRGGKPPLPPWAGAYAAHFLNFSVTSVWGEGSAGGRGGGSQPRRPPAVGQSLTVGN